MILAVVLGRTNADIDDTAKHATVLRAEVSWVEVDAIEQLGGHDARQSTKVIDERNDDAVDEHFGITGGGASHDEQTGEAGGTSHAGQVLNGPECIARGAWNLLDLPLLEGALGHLAGRSLASNDDFKRAFGGHAVHDLRDLVLGDLLLDS